MVGAQIQIMRKRLPGSEGGGSWKRTGQNCGSGKGQDLEPVVETVGAARPWMETSGVETDCRQPTRGGSWGSASKVSRGTPTPISSACLSPREVPVRCSSAPLLVKPPSENESGGPSSRKHSEGALCSSLPKKLQRPSWKDTQGRHSVSFTWELRTDYCSFLNTAVTQILNPSGKLVAQTDCAAELSLSSK